MRYLRTASTRRLLATIFGALGVAAACAAIAVAATGAGPVPRPTTLADGIHAALGAGRQHPVTGVSADITFTDNLIDSTDLTGRTVDPLLQGASGRLWWTSGGEFRLELQSDDGDAQIVVDHGSWWVSDPVQNVVFKGSMGSGSASGSGSDGGSGTGSQGARHGLPTIASIQAGLAKLMQQFNITGPTATDVAGRPAYSVSVSPKTSQGLLGSIQLAWDAARGIPLQFELYARGSTTPVLGLTATSISYGAVPASVFDISPPSGSQIVNVGDSGASPAGKPSAHHAKPVTGSRAVAAHVGFALHPPATVNGLPLRKVRLLGGHSALLLYGRGLGTIASIESRAPGGHSSTSSLDGLSLPTSSVDGASATVLSTPLGTVLRFTKSGVAYTVIGSVTAADAESAAGALAAGG